MPKKKHWIFIKRKFAILLLIMFLPIMSFSAFEDYDYEGLQYNFTYNFTMEMWGKYLLVVPYRFFHEVSASVNFVALKNNKGDEEFCFAGIASTGYVMATGGMTGDSLWFFTADYDLKRAAAFREKKIKNFKKNFPYYAKKIKKVRPRPMEILSKNEDAIRFDRSLRGIHYNPKINIQLTDSHSFTYSNIYKILGKLVVAYNHSFLPEGIQTVDVSQLEKWTGKIWHSNALDFSQALQEAAKLTSEGAEKNADFHQKKKFKLHYRITDIDNKTMTICGESFPKVKVWKKMNIDLTMRIIKIRMKDNVVLQDLIYLDFRDNKGKGGRVFLNLQLI